MKWRRKHLAPGPLTTRTNALVIAACHNEIHGLLALNPGDKRARTDAELLRAFADRLQRETFSLEPVVKRSERQLVAVAESANVARVVDDYQQGRDRPAGGSVA